MIDAIKVQNPSRNFKFGLKAGTVESQTNMLDTLGPSAYIGGGVVANGNVSGALGFDLSVLYAQNVFAPAGQLNGSSTNMIWIDAGPRYVFSFDATQLDDYLALKLLYHSKLQAD